MSDAANQPVEDVANKADEVVLSAFASGVDTSVDYPPQIEGLGKSSGGITVVDGATFEVESGTLTGLIGLNGAEKSTMLGLTTGTLKPDAGTATFNGEDIISEEPRRIVNRGMVRAFQIVRELSEVIVLKSMMLAPKYQRGETLWCSVVPDVCDDVRE